jgi:endonuclease III
MPRESAQAKSARVLKIIAGLRRTYPDAHCELNYSNPLELLVATILSAQCTDKQVNLVTADLFQKYRGAAAYAQAPLDELASDIRRLGFFRNKARSIQSCCQALLERHGGEVPRSMDELTRLAGVGRKTANVVLGNAFGLNEGIVVDTHVTRLSARLGLSTPPRPSQNRAAPDETGGARALDPVQPLADLARTPSLHRAPARLRTMRDSSGLSAPRGASVKQPRSCLWIHPPR